MPNLPPLHYGPYTDEERALIASYLLLQRAGTLSALESARSVTPGTTEGWAEGNERYYTNAESYSRFLLAGIGYKVKKDMMYGG